MRIDMRAHGVELDESLVTHIERKLRFALGRFTKEVRRVHVLVRDENGPKGGYDILCKVRAELSSQGELVIREVDTDPFSAVGRAAGRASHAIARRLERLRGRRRGRLRSRTVPGRGRERRDLAQPYSAA
jgi:ribosome-associated translation inhibitor RaiA